MKLEQLLKVSQSDVIIMKGMGELLRFNYSTIEESIKLLSDDMLNREVESITAKSMNNRFDSLTVICAWLKEPEVEEIPDEPIEDTPTEPSNPDEGDDESTDPETPTDTEPSEPSDDVEEDPDA